MCVFVRVCVCRWVGGVSVWWGTCMWGGWGGGGRGACYNVHKNTILITSFGTVEQQSLLFITIP